MGDKGWGKSGTLKTKAYPIRDGNHALVRLCHQIEKIAGNKA
jgi:hypothetical protein